jgi:hypothetical protein
VLALGILLCAVAFSFAVAPSMSLRGVPGPTFRMAEAPVPAIVATVGAFLASLVVACVVGRLINAVVGMFTLGCGVGFLALRSGAIEDLAFGGGSLSASAIESFVWAIAVLVSSLVVFRVSGPLPDAVVIDEPSIDGPVGSKGLLAQVAGALIIPALLFVAASTTKGQAVGAAVVGGMLAGLAGRLLAPKTPPILLYWTPVLFGAIGQLVAATVLSKGLPIDEQLIGRTLSRLAFPMPVDLAAGALVGVSLGIGWAKSFIKTEPAHA